MDLELQGKKALITGASRGIGAAIAGELAREGVDLFLVAQSRPDLNRVAERLRETTQRHIVIHTADLQAPAAADQIVRAALAAFGGLDILVNCAGATRSANFFAATDEDWLNAFGVKFHGGVRLSRSAWPHLRASRGCIVNIVGNTSRTGRADFGINGAVNAAFLNLTKVLSDIGRREGVRVNAINPGRFDTRRLARTLEKIAADHSVSLEHAAKQLLDSTGIARFGEPKEIGWLVAYLASPRADFIQGAIIEIDGGETRAL